MNKETPEILPPNIQETPPANGREDSRRVVSFIRNLIKPKNETASVRETIEELVELDSNGQEEKSVTNHEKVLISNVLKVRRMAAADVMVPRADIVAIAADATQEDLLALLAEKPFSRLPVYTETLDDVIGSVHVKDILMTLAQGQDVILKDLVREVTVISPAMPLLDLLLQMRLTRRHMVLVVDEFGGIDGLITIGDVIEAITGEIHDEHDPEDGAELVQKPDGTYIADARLTLNDFEIQFGNLLTDQEKAESDTLGGLVTYMSGHVPVRGEVITHSSGVVFEIIESDLRRVSRLRIGNIPKNHAPEK